MNEKDTKFFAKRRQANLALLSKFVAPVDSCTAEQAALFLAEHIPDRVENHAEFIGETEQGYTKKE